MNYMIAGGIIKFILINDFVFVSQDTSTGDFQAEGFNVIGYDSDGTNLKVKTLDGLSITWLTSTQIVKVWRAV